MPKMHTKPKPKPRGFAAMDKERLVEISREAGKKSQASGNGFRWSKLESKLQARRGGRARWQTKV